jgi:predicted nucleotidyltransferase
MRPSGVKDPRIPESVRPLLNEYLQRLAAELPDLPLGIYVHGSIAYDAFCEQTSDVDILVVTARECAAEELGRLARMHADLRGAWPRRKLEVSYVPEADCRRPHPESAPPHPYHHQNPYLDTGEFHDSGIFDFNHPLWAANLWWMVKTRGITLLGPEPEALGIPVSAADIVATSRHLLETYWPDWLRPSKELLKLHDAFQVDWVVFGTLRAYYTLRERDITSKPGAAEYGMAHLPRRWHGLIRSTLERRASPVEKSKLQRVREGVAVAFYLRFILRECRRIIASD